MKNTHNRGNVLFMILIGVILFAALSQAIVSSSRNSQTNTSSEALKAEASRIYNYIGVLRGAALRMSVQIPGDSLMYNNDIYKNNLGAAILATGVPANPAAYIFHPGGGNIAPQIFEKYSIACTATNCNDGNFTKPGHALFRWAIIPNIGSDLPEIVIMIFSPSRDLCLAFNQMTSINVIPGLALNSAIYQTASTINPSSGAAVPAGSGLATITGKTEFCYTERNASGTNHASTGYRIIGVMQQR